MADPLSLPPPLPFTGSVDGRRKDAFIQALATALQVPTKDSSGKPLTKAALARGCHQRLFGAERMKYQTNPVFAQLYIANEAEKSGKAAKNSADKATQDAVQDPNAPLTGANLKLHKARIPLDAPAGHFALKSSPAKSLSPLTEILDSEGADNIDDGRSKPRDADTSKQSDSDDNSSVADGRQSTNVSEDDNDGSEDDDSRPKPVVSHKDTKQGDGDLDSYGLIVNLSDPANPAHVEQVYLPEVAARRVGDKFRGQLSAIVPKLVETYSPVKADRAGRFARPAIGDTSSLSKFDLGSVGAVLDKNIHSSFNTERLNDMTLTDIGGGLLQCNLFFTPSGNNTFPAAAVTTAGPALVAISDGNNVSPHAELSESGTNVPQLTLHKHVKIAAGGGGSAPPPGGPPAGPNLSPPPPSDERWRQLLREIGGLVALDQRLPERVNITATDGIENFIAWTGYFDKFAIYRTRKGFAIRSPYVFPQSVVMLPDERAQYHDRTFTKEDIIAVSGWKPTTTKEIVGVFERALSRGLDDDHPAKLWAEGYIAAAKSGSADRPVADIAAMSWRQFKDLIKDDWVDVGRMVKSFKAQARTSKEAEGSKKRKRSDKEDKVHKNSKKRDGKGKKKDLNSSDLDASSD